MRTLEKRIEDAGNRLGLIVHKDSHSVFGSKDGILVQLLSGKEGEFIGIARWDHAEKDGRVRENLLKSKDLRSAGVRKPGSIKVGDACAVYTVARHTFGIGKLSSKDMVRHMRAIVKEVQDAVGKVPELCRVCGATSHEPVLVNGTIDRICGNCLEKTQRELRELAAAYESVPTHRIRALLVGVVLAAIGAIAWCASIIITGYMFWILAIGIGAAIGWGTVKAAGKGGLGIQVICVILTLFAIAGGMAIIIAFAALDVSFENEVLNTELFKENFLRIVNEALEDILFAIGGALVGAIAAARLAGKPKFGLSVEK